MESCCVSLSWIGVVVDSFGVPPFPWLFRSVGKDEGVAGVKVDKIDVRSISDGVGSIRANREVLLLLKPAGGSRGCTHTPWFCVLFSSCSFLAAEPKPGGVCW